MNMHRFLTFLLCLAVLAVPTTAWEASVSQNLAINVTQGQAIAAVSLSNNSFTGGAPSGTVVGAISVTMSPAAPTFSGSLSLTGTNASQFQIVGGNLATKGVVAAGTYQVNIVATEAGVGGSPFTQAEAIIGNNPVAPPPPPVSGVEMPGPSQALFNNPYYSCVTNRYVGGTGASDGNDGLTPRTAWATIQHANDMIASSSPGLCVNVAPGTYTRGAALTKGGNLASRTGYLVYRCTTMNGCTITASDHGFCWGSSCRTTNGPNYVIIDGFVFRANSSQAYGQGVQIWNGSPAGTAFSAHHVWLINNVFWNYGQSCVQMNDGEFFYVIHNVMRNCANSTGDARGSGISFVVLKSLAGYNPVADDLSNSTMGLYGPNFPFRIVANWNVVYLNSTLGFGTSDGNGIIFDSLANQDVPNGVDYPNRSLASFNVIYNNGGSGTQVFYGSHVTMANNSTFNNYSNLRITSTERSELDSSHGYDNHFINNIAVSKRPGNQSYVVGFANGSCSSPVCGTFANNLSLCNGSTRSDCAQTYQNNPPLSCSTNKCDTNPQYVNVGNASIGTDSTAPAAVNFALQPGSPAIGYGQAQSYLSPQSVDAGACYHTLTTCP
jgi:hypothetical protein